MSNPFSQYHNQISRCLDAVDEDSQDVLDTLTSQTAAAMKEIISTHLTWREDIVRLSQMAEHRDYLVHFYSDDVSLDDFLFNPEIGDGRSHIQILPHLVYELVALGAPRPSNLDLIDISIQKIVMKAIGAFRRALLSNCFDATRIEDRLQDAMIELIRAARSYRNIGNASFITYAWRRVMVKVNRQSFHSQLVVKVSNRDVENAFRTVEMNAGSTTHLTVSNFLPNAVDIDDCEPHNSRNLCTEQTNESSRFRRDIRAKLIASLNNLKPNEKVVILGECGLFGSQTLASELASMLDLSRSSYSHSKNNALKKLGFYKTLDEKWHVTA